MEERFSGVCSSNRFSSLVIRGFCLAFLLTQAVMTSWFSAEECFASELMSPVLSPASVPAKGRQQAILTTNAFGRYAVIVKSPQGTSVQLIDRMDGPGEIMGSAGEEDGRLDLFLDRGEYKIITRSPEKGSGKAQIEVHTFKELNSPKPPMLVEFKQISDSLQDFEQRSYWLEVKERRWVALEAAGRNLADLRLWKDGNWLVDAESEKTVSAPKIGQPLLVCRLAVNLEPGLYLLTAYGGKGQAWAEDSKEHPFHLRFGIPILGTAGRSRFIASPFGIDRRLVPGDANFFRVEIPEALPVSFTVSAYDVSRPFAEEGAVGHIRKNSIPPVAEIDVQSQDTKSYHLVTVNAEAGQPFVLQHFEKRSEYYFKADGDYWISTVNTGHPGDAIDATAVLDRWNESITRRKPYQEKMPEISGSRGWTRRANLLDTLTVFLKVTKTGTYEITSKGTEAKFNIEPFFIYRPSMYKSPALRGSGSEWELDEGYYIFTAVPVKKGILDVTIRPKGIADVLYDMLGEERDIKANAMSADVRFPKLSLSREFSYTLYLNMRPEVKSGMVIRKLPVDISKSLPLALIPGETVTVPVSVSESGEIRVQAEDGSLLETSINSGPWIKAVSAEKGTYTISVRNTGKNTVIASMIYTPLRLKPETPLPVIPDSTLSAIPKFSVLAEKNPQFFDISEGGTATFSVRSDKPALYRLESTGLLAVEGNLRSRTITSLNRQASNGTGRNFLVQQYLREGDYQVTVTAQGKSAGHAGINLSRSELISGGELAEGIPARITLPAGKAVVYKFSVRKKGRYHLQSLGTGRSSVCRLEDGEGWPLEKPGIPADFDRIFEPGKYRLVILPDPVESRRSTLLKKFPAIPKYKGHGPHLMRLEKTIEHLWREPQSGKERIPDKWKFVLPALAEVTVELTGEMEGILYLINEDNSEKKIAQVPPGRGWKGELEKGPYRLDAVCSRKNDRVDYVLKLTSKELLPGYSRQLTLPAVITVSVPPASGKTSGLVDLWSYGPVDIRAGLYDIKGRLIAKNDDRPDDWNFQIAQRLEPGIYTLQIEPVGLPAQGKRAKSQPQNTEEYEHGAAPAEDYQEDQENYSESEAAPESDNVMQAPPAEGPETEAAENEIAGTEKPTTAPVTGNISLYFDLLPETVKPALKVPAEIELHPGKGVNIFPLVLPANSEFLVLSANSDESVGLALEMLPAGGTEWKSIDTVIGRNSRIELPIHVKPDINTEQFRLRVWSADRRGSKAKIIASAPVPKKIDEQALSKGVTLDAASAVVSVSLSHPGVFRLSGVRASASENIPCRESKRNLVEAGGNVFWIVKDIAQGKTAHLTGDRLVVSPENDPVGNHLGLPLQVTAENTIALDITVSGTGPVLSIATSGAAQPGIRMAERAELSSGTTALLRAGHKMTVGINSAASVSLNPKEPVLLLWSADTNEDSSIYPVDVHIQSVSFPVPERGTLSSGSTNGSLKNGIARAFSLPDGGKMLRVVLGEGLVGVLSKDNSVTDILWAGGKPYEETLYLNDMEANRLTLLQPSSGEGHFAIEVLPGLPGESSAFGSGKTIEKVEMRSGIMRLNLTPGTENKAMPLTLHMRGTEADSFLISKEGHVMRGSDIQIPPEGGKLLIHHKPGLILLWTSRADSTAGDLWEGFGPPKVTDVVLPARVALSGKSQILRLNNSEPILLHLRAAAPAVTFVKTGFGISESAKEPVVEAHPEGTSMEIYLPEGLSEIGLRALGGNDLFGEAVLFTTKTIPIGEGLGPEIILPAGGSQVFSFKVKRKGPVGIGVRSEADTIETILLDSMGKKITTGVISMPVLEPGNYILILKAPADSPPLRARPALAGVEPPAATPPAEVIQEYAEKAGITGKEKNKMNNKKGERL
jgi:hypothetical protein